MAQHRPNLPPATKEALRAQAGGKCANPGCPAKRTQLHHIRERAIYQSHDKEHLIAVCPSCHDAIHHGVLPIDDETVYRSKSITRVEKAARGHLYVEPSREAKLVLGSIAVTGDAGLVVFELSEGNRPPLRGPR
jgi:HNH endonuclease